MASTPDGAVHNRSLDALRGLAAIAITVGHAIGFPGGGLPHHLDSLAWVVLEFGMAIFFALSGYLIAKPFVNALLAGSATPDLRSYALRRTARVVPAYYAAWVLSALILTATTPLLTDPNSTFGMYPLRDTDVVNSAFFLQLFNADAIRGYFVMPQMWSLPIELIFYAVVPVVALFAARRVAPRRLSPRSAVLGVITLWGVTAAATWIAVTVYGTSGWSSGVGASVALTAAYLSCFWPGVLLAIAHTKEARQEWAQAIDSVRAHSTWLLPALAAATFGVGYAIFMGSQQGVLPTQLWRRHPEAMAAGILLVMAMRSRHRLWLAIVRVLAPVGTISYSIYLLHWMIIRELFHHQVLPLPGVPYWAWFPVKVAVVFGLVLPLAWLSYMLVERPAMRWASRRFVSPGRPAGPLSGYPDVAPRAARPTRALGYHPRPMALNHTLQFAEVRVADRVNATFAVDSDSTDPIGQWVAREHVLDEPPLRLVLDLISPGCRFLDVGAHLGGYSLAAAALGADVVAVEGSPANAQLLRMAGAYGEVTNLRVVNAVATAVDGPVGFAAHGPWGCVDIEGEALGLDITTMPGIALGSLCTEVGWDHVDVMKIDIEGWEPRAFEGMRSMLASDARPIVVFESNATMLERIDESPRTLLEMMAGFGYDHLYYVERSEPPKLVPVTPTTLQTECVADYLACTGLPARLSHWQVAEPATEMDLIGRLVRAAADTHVGYRQYAAQAIGIASPAIRDDAEIQASVRALALDPDDSVRDLATSLLKTPGATLPAGDGAA